MSGEAKDAKEKTERIHVEACWWDDGVSWKGGEGEGRLVRPSTPFELGST